MIRENFAYCDEVSVLEESENATIDRHANKTMSIHCYEEVAVYPYSAYTQKYQGEVFTLNNERINGVNPGTIYSGKTLIIEALPPTDSDVEEAIYLGSQEMCWGHYFTDGISKMWCLNDPCFKTLVNKGLPIYFCPDWMMIEEMPRVWKELIDLLGGQGLIIKPLKRNTRFHRLHIPSNSLFNTDKGRFFTDDYVHLIAMLRSNALSGQNGLKTYDKLYLSRTHLTIDHAEFGERQLEKAFKHRGFHIIYPERLSFKQQIWLLWNAKEVAGTMGSISHNFVFCRPDTKAVIIRKACYTNDYQYILNQVSKIDVTYIDAHLSVFVTPQVNEGPFYMYINNNVTHYLSDTYGSVCQPRFNRRLFQKYAMLCLKRPCFEQRTSAPLYYYHKMFEELNDNRSRVQSLYKILLTRYGEASALQRIVKRILKLFNR